ncbi:MAG: hypothetical protein LBT18_02660 [Endomicrobium sp.]|jgi:hypothetical protein|nr:hypothetical protein [Endomicrobium sp.]
MAYSQLKGDVSLSNGFVVNDDATGYQHISSVNNGITYFGTAETFNFRLDTGMLSSFAFSNNDIIFTDITPIEGSTITTTTEKIGITVTTYQGNIRQIKYRIAQDITTLQGLPYSVVYSSWDAGVTVGPTISISTITSNVLKPGLNYVQWFAQNTNSTDGKDQVFIIYVNDTEAYIKILQPGQIVPIQPVIKAEVYSVYGFDESSVKIKMFVGKSTTTAPISIEDGTGKFKDESGKHLLDYKYKAVRLVNDQQYTLLIEFTDKNNTIKSSFVTFTASAEPIAQLLPYPSPYDPNKGKPMKIKYVLNDDTSVTINIYDRVGKFVSKVIYNEKRYAGANYDDWAARNYAGDNLANGIYICEIIVNNGEENRRYRSFAILRK